MDNLVQIPRETNEPDEKKGSIAQQQSEVCYCGSFFLLYFQQYICMCMAIIEQITESSFRHRSVSDEKSDARAEQLINISSLDVVQGLMVENRLIVATQDSESTMMRLSRLHIFCVTDKIKKKKRQSTPLAFFKHSTSRPIPVKRFKRLLRSSGKLG